MKAALRLLTLFALVPACVPAAFAAGHTHMPNTTWKLNVGKSDFGNGPVMKADTYMIHTDTDKWLTFDDTTIDADGKTWKISWSGPQDGTMHPVKGMPGATMSSRTADDSSHFVMPDGTTEDQFLSLSADKKTATIKVDGKTRDGKTFHQTMVYDRAH